MSETKETTKLCTGCNTLKTLSEDFYKAGEYYQRLCKVCHNATRKRFKRTVPKYVKRPRGFDKLSPERKEKIIDEYLSGKSMLDIARDNNIKYCSIRNWRKKGYLNSPIQEPEAACSPSDCVGAAGCPRQPEPEPKPDTLSVPCSETPAPSKESSPLLMPSVLERTVSVFQQPEGPQLQIPINLLDEITV